jgi:hypothetical protein
VITEEEKINTMEFQYPDYETLRPNEGFSWSVVGTPAALLELTDIPIREYFLNPRACIELYRKGRPLLRELFGDDVIVPPPATPSISYGHVNTLGSNLIFPDDGEVAHTPIYDSLDEGINALQKHVEFATSGMAPFYEDFYRQLQKAFPEERISFSFGPQGPITTAWLLRGEGFFYDLYDQPEVTLTFLELVSRSINDFHQFWCKVQNDPCPNPQMGGMGDDIASMIPPHLWPKFVLPFWDLIYRGKTTGKRHVHVEDLRTEHLAHLETIGLASYDPSISPKLNPQIIFRECRIPFSWRLGCIHYPSMSQQDVSDFVYQAAADGASSVFTVTANHMLNQENFKKVRTFAKAGKDVKRLLDSRVSRKDLKDLVSSEGKQKFWDHWPV